MNKFGSAASDGSYAGSELEIFAHASNWKAYYKQIIRPYIGRDVLEVGAGLGATTAALCDGEGQWVCLEPDAQLAGRIADSISNGKLPAVMHARKTREFGIWKRPPENRSRFPNGRSTSFSCSWPALARSTPSSA